MAGELGVLYVSLDHFRTSGLWSLPPYFNAYYAVLVLMASYAWGLPVMYGFMMKQRKKYLGGGGAAAGSSGGKPKARRASKKTD